MGNRNMSSPLLGATTQEEASSLLAKRIIVIGHFPNSSKLRAVCQMEMESLKEEAIPLKPL
jgi:hypothetical protein